MNRPNLNQRIYPTYVLKKAIEDYTNEYIKKDRAFVCNNPPRSENINLLDVIGKVTHIEMDDYTVTADIEKLNVNDSANLWPLIESGKLSIRLSGMGSLTQQIDGTFLVNNDYKLLALMTTTDPA